MGTTEIDVESIEHKIRISKDVGDTVYVDFEDRNGENGYANLTRSEVYEFIIALATKAEIYGGYNVASDKGGIIVNRPDSKAVIDRRNELSHEFFGCSFASAGGGAKAAVEYIVEGERSRGELA
jgi:hypothetical protein